MERKETIADVVGREWNMFKNAQNAGGKAGCQDEEETFGIMRRAQFAAWSDDMLESYLGDLKAAQDAGRNMMSEKYGYMMCISDPEGNTEIIRRLPTVSPEKRQTARRIVDRLIPQNETFRSRYPRVSARGRPLRTSEEPAAGWTSIETYELGELWTYSQKTLELFQANLDTFEKEGKSYPETVVENGLKLRSFKSLQEAEEFLL